MIYRKQLPKPLPVTLAQIHLRQKIVVENPTNKDRLRESKQLRIQIYTSETVICAAALVAEIVVFRGFYDIKVR